MVSAIRADVVKGFRAASRQDATAQEFYHVVVPVNAGTVTQIKDIAGMIIDMDGVAHVDIMMVEVHIPKNPWHADGFIAF